MLAWSSMQWQTQQGLPCEVSSPPTHTLQVHCSGLQLCHIGSQSGCYPGGHGTKGRKYKNTGIMAAFLACFKEYMSSKSGHLDVAAATVATL